MRPFTATMSTAVLAVAAALAVPATVPAAVSAAPSAGHVTGTLPDGATWIADVPAQWNGTLLLYSHGFGPLIAADAPDPATQAALLARGYAIVNRTLDGKRITSAIDAAPGTSVNIQLGKGQLTATIKERKIDDQ